MASVARSVARRGRLDGVIVPLLTFVFKTSGCWRSPLLRGCHLRLAMARSLDGTLAKDCSHATSQIGTASDCSRSQACPVRFGVGRVSLIPGWSTFSNFRSALQSHPLASVRCRSARQCAPSTCDPCRRTSHKRQLEADPVLIQQHKREQATLRAREKIQGIRAFQRGLEGGVWK